AFLRHLCHTGGVKPGKIPKGTGKFQKSRPGGERSDFFMGDLIDPNTTQQVQEALQDLSQVPLTWERIGGQLLDFLPRLLTAGVVLAVGYLVLRWLCSLAQKLLR